MAVVKVTALVIVKVIATAVALQHVAVHAKEDVGRIAHLIAATIVREVAKDPAFQVVQTDVKGHAKEVVQQHAKTVVLEDNLAKQSGSNHYFHHYSRLSTFL